MWTRRAWLVGSFAALVRFAGGAFARQGRGGEGKDGEHRDEGKPPVTGQAGPGLGRFDEVMLETLRKHDVPGASLCLAKDGRLVFARGYGWADVKAREPVRPETLFGIGSVSKSITAVAVLKLVEQGKLGLDDRAFDILKDLEPLPGKEADPRVREITVRQLLNHTSGYEKPAPVAAAAAAFRVRETEVTADQMIRYRLGQPLDYSPGAEAHYSNYGYLILGQIVERVSEMPYPRYVERHVFEPSRVRHAAYGTDAEAYPAGLAHGYDAHGDELPPPRQRPAGAAGSWVTSGVELARFLTAVGGTRGPRLLSAALTREMLAPPPPPVERRKNGSHFGLGWDLVLATPRGPSYAKNGAVPGYRAFIGHTPGGVDWAVLLNGGGAGAEQETADAAAGILREVQRTDAWPADDLFGRFR
jgi:N-acyl-D-amino-acid deacylase